MYDDILARLAASDFRRRFVLKDQDFIYIEQKGLDVIAHHAADFIAKLQIALKECSESEYWLELLEESGYWADPAILEQCREVKRLLIASINTAKKNMN